MYHPLRHTYRLRLTAALACSLLVTLAAAQSGIMLQGGAGQTVTFTGMGAGTSSLEVNLGACGFGDSCLLYGMAQGSGSLSSTGILLLDSTPGSLLLTPDASTAFTLSTTAPMALPYVGFSSASGQTGLLLNGVLNLLSFQTSTSAQGDTMADFGGYLTVSGDNLLSVAAGSTLNFQLSVMLPALGSLSGLLGTGNSLSAALTGASLTAISPAPEPATWLLLLLGALLLLAAARLRRPHNRHHAASRASVSACDSACAYSSPSA